MTTSTSLIHHLSHLLIGKNMGKSGATFTLEKDKIKAKECSFPFDQHVLVYCTLFALQWFVPFPKAAIV
jgi:hypothetical protein